jgi:hypothetical protein
MRNLFFLLLALILELTEAINFNPSRSFINYSNSSKKYDPFEIDEKDSEPLKMVKLNIQMELRKQHAASEAAVKLQDATTKQQELKAKSDFEALSKLQDQKIKSESEAAAKLQDATTKQQELKAKSDFEALSKLQEQKIKSESDAADKLQNQNIANNILICLTCFLVGNSLRDGLTGHVNDFSRTIESISKKVDIPVAGFSFVTLATAWKVAENVPNILVKVATFLGDFAVKGWRFWWRKKGWK